MNSIIKFNKHIIEFNNNVIKEFIDKIKLKIPDEFHHIIDEQYSNDNEQIKLNTKKPKKSKSDITKKPKKMTAYNAFTTFRLKELKGQKSQDGESTMTICGKEWNIMKSNGQDKIWQQKADEHNNTLSDNEQDKTPIQSDDEIKSDTEEPMKEIKTKKDPKAKKEAKKTKTKKSNDNLSDDEDNIEISLSD